MDLSYTPGHSTDLFVPTLENSENGQLFFTPLKIGLTEISRSRFKQYKNPMLITQINVLGCFVNFWVIFRYIWEEIVFLKRVVKLRETRSCFQLILGPYLTAWCVSLQSFSSDNLQHR